MGFTSRHTLRETCHIALGFPRAICFKGDRGLKLTSNLLLVPGSEYMQLHTFTAQYGFQLWKMCFKEVYYYMSSIWLFLPESQYKISQFKQEITINSQLDATTTGFIGNYNQINMFRAIISPILRSTRRCLQLVVKCTDDAACREHRRCIIPQTVNTVQCS